VLIIVHLPMPSYFVWTDSARVIEHRQVFSLSMVHITVLIVVFTLHPSRHGHPLPHRLLPSTILQPNRSDGFVGHTLLTASWSAVSSISRSLCQSFVSCVRFLSFIIYHNKCAIFEGRECWCVTRLESSFVFVTFWRPIFDFLLSRDLYFDLDPFISTFFVCW